MYTKIIFLMCIIVPILIEETESGNYISQRGLSDFCLSEVPLPQEYCICLCSINVACFY
ncbi:hypothetical protein X975_24560, partial [Stegodyphus mimosarum]